MCRQKLLDFLPQSLVGSACNIEKRRHIRRITLESGLEYLPQSGHGLRRHTLT
jgi:hypothetical protein